jgi:hypothetical protein
MVMAMNENAADKGNQPTMLPPEPENLVVVTFDGRCFQYAVATCSLRLVLVWTDEDYDEEDESVVDVDGEFVSVEEVEVSDDGIDADTMKVLKAAGIEVPDFSGTGNEGKGTSE